MGCSGDCFEPSGVVWDQCATARLQEKDELSNFQVHFSDVERKKPAGIQRYVWEQEKLHGILQGPIKFVKGVRRIS